MKFGIRTPSLKRRFAARTSLKRYVRHSLGLKAPRGFGLLTNPKKALYNRVYNKTTISVDKLLKVPSVKKIAVQPTTVLPKGIQTAGMGKIIRSSSKALTVTSKNFEDLRKQITEIYTQRVEIKKQLSSAKFMYYFLTFVHFASFLFIIGFFYKRVALVREAKHSEVTALEKQLSETYVKLTFADKTQLEKSWLNCIDAFNELMKSEKIWDMTYAEDVDRVKARTIAKTATKRTEIHSAEGEIEFIKSDLSFLFLPNANGADLFLYPTFLLLFKDNEEFGIFDLTEISVNFQLTGYIEEEHVPGDTETISQTWKKANKDGSRDKRFNGNYQIPVVKYGQLSFESDSGLDEYYMFSNPVTFSEFGASYSSHLGFLKKNNA